MEVVKIKLFRTLFYSAIAAGALYAGSYHNARNAKDEMDALKAKVQHMGTIDYKVESLIKDNMIAPKKVEQSFQEFYKKYLSE